MKAASANHSVTSDAATERPAYATISLLGWAHFLNDGASNYLPGILPAVLVSLNLSVSLAGTLMAALIVGQALQPLTGLLSDRIGGRGFTMAGLAFTSIAGAAVAFTPNLATLAVALIVLGIANGCFHPQSLAAVRRASRQKAGTGLSIFLIGGEIGRGIWPLAASLLVAAGGIGSIWILGLPGIVTLPFLWRLAPRVPPRPEGAAKVRWALHIRPLTTLVLFASLRSVLLYAISTFVPILWHARGGSLVGGAGLITTLMTVGIVGNFIGGRLADRVRLRPIIGTAMAVGLLSMVGFLFSGGIWMWVLISLAGAGISATFPLTVLIGQNIVPENRSFGSGMALGLSNALGALGVMALSPLAGSAGITIVLWAAIACGAVTLLLVPLLQSE